VTAARPSPKTNYRVALDAFEGPLDLLLHLVDSEKMDITEISLAAVAEQYRAYLKSLEKMNLELESSYIVVFAQLLEIKSRILLPSVAVEFDDFYPSEAGYEDEVVPDAPNDLVEQLKAYKLLKEAADWLGQRELFSFGQYAHNNPVQDPDQLELDVSLEALAAAWLRMDTSMKRPRKPVEIRKIELSVPERVQQILAWLRTRTRGFFSQLLPEEWSKTYITVTFLATLELARRSKVRLEQTSIHDDIEITLLCEEPA
jgi:segregation and condensation protein A